MTVGTTAVMAEDLVGYILAFLVLIRKGALTLEPSFDVPVINITVVVGKTAILPCSVEFLGDHKVVWTDEFSTLLTFDNKRIIDDDRIGIDRPYTRDWNLIIHDVKVKDRGRYICQINTQPIKTKPVDLNVLVPPQILNDEGGRREEIIAKEGDTVNVVCNVSGIPAPSVKWYRRPLTDTEGNERESLIISQLDTPGSRSREPCIYTFPGESGIGMEGEILVIHNVSRFCDGVYQCVASNDVPPAVEMETEVIVEFQPEVTMVNTRLSQEKGKETILMCYVTAFPQALSYWMYRGQEVPTSERIKVEIYSENKPHTIVLSLRVLNISEADYGEYECVASNKLGRDWEAMILAELRHTELAKKTTAPAVIPTTSPRRSLVALVTYKPLVTEGLQPFKPGETSFVSSKNGGHFLHKNLAVVVVTLILSSLSIS